MTAADQILALPEWWMTAHRLAGAALTWDAIEAPDYGDGPIRSVWEVIAVTQDEARAYYGTIDNEERLREEAAQALAAAGWTRDSICRRLS